MKSLSPGQENNIARVNCISLRMGHHAGPSGYDRITQALGVNVINTPTKLSFADRAVARLLKPLVRKSGIQWYTRNSLCTELHTAARMFGPPRQLFHFLYGENSYRYLGQFKKLSPRKHWLAATYHTPVWRLQELMSDFAHLKLLDAAMVVSTNQMDFFRGVLSDRVFFIPHGIDTDFFCPEEMDPGNVDKECAESDKQLRFVMVGSHLRDFDLARLIVERMAAEQPSVKFDIVARKEDLEKFRHFPNVKCHLGVSDLELRDLYRRATALMLPLTDCTANNALLEAMACGLPIISSDLVGVRDYVEAENAFLLPSKLDDWLNTLNDFCKHTVNSTALGVASRLQAEKFAWPEVAKMQRDVYLEIAKQ